MDYFSETLSQYILFDSPERMVPSHPASQLVLNEFKNAFLSSSTVIASMPRMLYVPSGILMKAPTSLPAFVKPTPNG